MLNIVPDNPAKAMADGNMLQIIAFAVLIGLGIAILGKRVQGIHSLLEQGNELMMYLVNLVMKLAPMEHSVCSLHPLVKWGLQASLRCSSI